MPQTISQSLADYFTSLSIKALTPDNIAVAKTLTSDYLGVALGGSKTESGRIAARFATEMGGKPEATLIGQTGRVSAVHAAFANAIASHSIELDDIDVLALFHFSPPVVSAALATAEKTGSTGAETVTAIFAGCEMMERASRATNNSLRNRGFHTTPTCGVFGATVAAGILLKLTSEQMVSALGLAGAQASGLMEMYGPSAQKRFNPGPTARNGVTAAIMASMGFTGTDLIFEGERGFCKAFSDGGDLGELTRELGQPYELLLEYKPYSCARPIHNAIDCALDVRRQMKEPLSEVRSIAMRRHPDWAHYHLNATPKTYHEAQVSLPYSVAIALLEGAALPPQYQNSKLADPDIRRLSDLVTVTPDASLPRGVSCHMTLETSSGATYTSQIDYPRGSVQNPMTRSDMDQKSHMLGDDVIGEQGVAQMLERVSGMDGLPQISGLMEGLQRAGA
jgi:2-methylcitrate dehydratase PrpD